MLHAEGVCNYPIKTLMENGTTIDEIIESPDFASLNPGLDPCVSFMMSGEFGQNLENSSLFQNIPDLTGAVSDVKGFGM